MHLNRLSETRLALGSDVTLCIVTDADKDAETKLFNELWKQIYGFEKRCSRFLPNSELSRFNRSSGLKVPVSNDFLDILRVAKRFATKTNGLYNPFITPALQKAGYIKSAVPGYEHDAQIDYTDRRVVEINRLDIEESFAKIPFGTALDLGGCGKGYLADLLGQTLDSKDYVYGYCLSFGGDVITKGLDENGNRMTIDIQNANDLDTTTDWIIDCPESKFATATSGSIRRPSQYSRKDWHHIIDPTTLEPAKTDIVLATVCSNDATLSDVLASCAIVLGSKKAPAFLKKHGAKSALLQCVDKDDLLFERVFGRSVHKVDYYKSRKFAVNA